MKNYTDTKTFRKEVESLKKNGVSEEVIADYTKAMGNFDENGMDNGTDYSNIVLAFPHPIP